MLITLKQAEGLLHRRVYDALKGAILEGRLNPGTRLPSTRTLASDLGVSRNTAMLAYEQLLAEGYLVSRRRAATVVAETPPRPSAPSAKPPTEPPRLSAYGRRLMREPAVPPAGSYVNRPGLRYDFRYGRPAIDEFPREIWRKLLAARARRAARDTFGYAPPAGYKPLREALAGYLARARGLSCTAEQIVIVNGSQQAFDLIARLLIDPGDKVVVEEPHYHGSRIPFEAAGARIIPVAVDASGLDTSRLARLTAGARLACVTPCHQFPTGVIMPLARRLALLDWAARHSTWVVEDDYVSEFRYEGQPIEALHALDRHGRVIYVGTFSKTLFPALRLAYVVLPPTLIKPFQTAKWTSDRYSTLLGQEALTDFITSGQFERYLRRASGRNAGRRRALIAALHQHLGSRVKIAGDNAGVHLLVWLRDIPPRKVGALIERAAQAGIGLYPITPYYSQPPKRAGLLLGYASLSESAIRAGIRRFAEIMVEI